MEKKDGVVQTTEQDNTSDDKVSYFVLEGIMTHFSVIIKRLIRAFIIVAVLFSLIIAGLIYYISLPVEEYDKVDIQNDTGNANYIGNDMIGDFNYGKDN